MDRQATIDENHGRDVVDPRSDALRLSYGALTGCTAEQLDMFRGLIYEIEGLRKRVDRQPGSSVPVEHKGGTYSTIVQIYKCGGCGGYFHTIDRRKYTFCPNCGGRIEYAR